MQKLLELWEVDDSSLSSHSLQASNSLSVNKHLSLHSEKPVLEQLHHVDSLKVCDSSSIGLKNSHGPEMAWSQSSTVESPDVRFCVKCRHANEERANWCIECGTALMGTKIEMQSGDELTDLNGESSTELLPPLFDRVADQNSASYFEINSLDLSDRHAYDVKTLNDQDQAMVHTEYSVCGDYAGNKQTTSVPKSPVRSCTSPIMSKTHPNNRTKKFCNTTMHKNATTSQLVTRKEYQRHWNTSSTYMWRKPSSIPNSTSCLVNDAHQLSNGNKERHTSISVLPKLQLVPILDLDAIDEGSVISTSVCTSIRTSSSGNEVWMLGAGVWDTS